MNNIIKFSRKTYKGCGAMCEKISYNRMLEIEEIVNKLLKKYNTQKNPYVDIVHLVGKDNFEVKPAPMDIETTGCLLVNDKEKPPMRLIKVNTFFKNPDNERDVVFKKSRFITAHEYGHYILHKKNENTIYAHRDTYHRTDPLELEADYFARSILMPLKQFKMYNEILNDMGNNDDVFTIDILSKIFKVTKNKIKSRMEDVSVLKK